MPFLGKQPTAGFSTIVKDDLTPDGSTTAFTLSKNVASANDIAVFVGNVRQEPTDAYSVSGTTLTMTAAPASGVNFYVLHIAGTVESSVVPADGTITTAKLNSSIDLSGKTVTYGAISGTTGDFSGNLTVGSQISTTGDLVLDAPFSTIFKKSGVTEAIINQNGLSFDGGSNYMGSWETGTFDCSITQGGGTTSTQTALGYYAKLGDWVYVHGQTTITSVGSGGSILGITMPFSCVGGYRGGIAVGINQPCALPAGAGNGYLNLIMELSSTRCYIVGTAIGGGHHHLGIGNLGTGLFSFGGVYRAA